MKANNIPDAIQWHEGLLLTPQHFQQLTLRHESLVQYSTSLSTPFCWGLRRFKHDAISLPAGKFVVQELEAVMPDGLLVWHDSQAATSLEVDLTKYAEKMIDQPVTVYLAVVADQNGSSNDELNKYEPFKRKRDDASGGNGRDIYRLRPRLSLLVKDVPKKYIGFPLARVSHKESFSLDEKFIPPLVAIPIQSTAGEADVVAAARLAEMCSAMAKKIRKRAMYLADEERTAAQGTTSRSDVTSRVMLSLVAGLPAFEAMLKIGVAHPLAVYLALCAVAGQLTVLGKEMLPPSFNAYDHNDLYATFKPLLDFIRRSLDEGVPLSYKSFPFVFEEGVFHLHFDGSWTNKRLALGIRRPHGMSDDYLIKWGESCLIASQGRLEAIRENRIRGAVRKHVERMGDVVPGKGVALFSLTADEDFIKPDEMLQIFNDGSRPAEIVLHVLDPAPDIHRHGSKVPTEMKS
ncbi:MAG: type VI secretion system baseplate subunit TssK [Acidobacteria bacterium]|nr:MAG: type VI secretion system baseplate subunit TssK [Acidobacteriota bacterium]